MKIGLVGLNARYSHSNLAIKYLAEEVKDLVSCQLYDFTINDQKESIIHSLLAGGYDYLGFSTYIWNADLVKDLVRDLKTIVPDVKIILGGPEVSFESEDFLLESRADYLIVGEGEGPFRSMVQAFLQADDPVHESVLENKGGQVLGSKAYAISREIPVIYEDDRYIEENKYVYYEASRGCPYNCAFCLSSSIHGVRFKDIDLVKRELQTFLDARVGTVKFIDRSFNFNPKQMEILRYLHENDNGHTTFHLEIHPSLIDDGFADFIKGARSDLFQFEIGVQTTNERTAREIKRAGRLGEISTMCRKLIGSDAHIHMDLIAGLPYEDIGSFKKSFNDLYDLGPEKIQLGFLKLLKGSELRIRAEEYAYKYFEKAPYEVIANKWLSYEDIMVLKGIEDMVERYYNEAYFAKSLGHIVENYYQSAWDFFEDMAGYWREKQILYTSISRLDLFNILIDFLKEDWDKPYLYELIIFDYYMAGNKRSTKFALNDYHKKYDNQYILDLVKGNDAYIRSQGFDSKYLLKKSVVEIFKIDENFEMSEDDFYHVFIRQGNMIKNLVLKEV